MSREAHVRFWESAGVRFPRATHLPYTRLSKIIARQGAHIPVSTLSSWEKLAEPVARVVVDAAWEQAVTKCQVMGIDATGIRIVDSPHDRRAHIWVSTPTPAYSPPLSTGRGLVSLKPGAAPAGR